MTKQPTKNQLRVAEIQKEMQAKMLDLMKQGGNAWFKPWEALNGVPINPTTDKLYRGYNAFMLALISSWKFDGEHRFAGTSQLWKQGYKIKKGTKKTEIFFPKFRYYEDDDGEKQKYLYDFGISWVVNISQVEHKDTGKPYPAIEKSEPKFVGDKVPAIESFIENLKIEIRDGGDSASFNWRDNFIKRPLLESFLGTDDTPPVVFWYKTTFHELGHATGYKDRLNRKIENMFGTVDYAAEELVAEFTSASVCKYFGIDNPGTDKHHAAYLKNWIALLEDKPDALSVAATAAGKAFEWMLEQQ
jgi:antirestriction protein ArdC